MNIGSPFQFRRLALTAGVLLVLASVPLHAAGPYLGSNAPDAIALLPPPPPAGSPEDVADREMAFRVYSAHTPEQFELGVATQCGRCADCASKVLCDARAAKSPSRAMHSQHLMPGPQP